MIRVPSHWPRKGILFWQLSVYAISAALALAEFIRQIPPADDHPSVVTLMPLLSFMALLSIIHFLGNILEQLLRLNEGHKLGSN